MTNNYLANKKIQPKLVLQMGLGWDSVLKLGAFGACLMIAILAISLFVGVSYDSFWFSVQITIAVLLFILILISWRTLKRRVNK